MLLVVDSNVVFSSLVRKGKPLRVFELNKIFAEFEFVTPEYMFFEIGRRIDRILKFSHFSKEEFADIFSFIKEQIELIPLEAFEDCMNEARKKAPHEKDVPYVALALKLDCKIFSGDKGLKDALPDSVITPSEAIDMLLGKSE